MIFLAPVEKRAHFNNILKHTVEKVKVVGIVNVGKDF